jgi:flagellar FliL protein
MATAPKSAAKSAAKPAAKPDEDERGESEEEESGEPAKKKFKLRLPRGPLLIIIGSALGAAVIASGVTYLLVPKHPAKTHHAAVAAAAPAKAPAAAPDAAPEAAADAAPDAADAGDAPADADKTPPKPAIYLEFNPAFTVNLSDTEAMRFLQITVEVMARDQLVIDAVKEHMPRIRNALMLLFGQQKASDIATREAKEALQQKALDEVVNALKAENSPSAVEAVYFTSLVIQ